MSLNQSIEIPLTIKDTATLYGQVGTQNGVGSESINFATKRVFSDQSWAEVDIGAGNGLTIAFKGFKTMTKKIFSNGVLEFQTDGFEITPRLNFSMQIAFFIQQHFSFIICFLFKIHYVYFFSPCNAIGPPNSRISNIQIRSE